MYITFRVLVPRVCLALCECDYSDTLTLNISTPATKLFNLSVCTVEANWGFRCLTSLSLQLTPSRLFTRTHRETRRQSLQGK